MFIINNQHLYFLFFQIRTLRVLILPKTTSDHYSSSGRHSSYLLLAICVTQPVLMYILTKHLVSFQAINEMELTQ